MEFKLPYYKYNKRTGVIRSLKTNKIVGKVKLSIYDGFEDEVCLDYFMLRKSYQGKGLAKKMMNALINQAKKQNMKKIELFACPIGNQRLEENKLKKYYRSFGFRSYEGRNSSDMKLILKK